MKFQSPKSTQFIGFHIISSTVDWNLKKSKAFEKGFKMAREQKRWFDPKELEEEYGISQSTQAKYRMQKKIPFSKIGSKFIRYDSQKIEKWLENHEIVGAEI